MIALLFLLFGTGAPIDSIIHVEVIEENWVWQQPEDNNDIDAGVWFKQWVFWDHYDNTETLHVRGWLFKSNKTVLRKRKDVVELTYSDTANRMWRIQAKEYRFVASLKDREVEDRKFVPLGKRPRFWTNSLLEMCR